MKTDFNNLTKETIGEIWDGSPNIIDALQGVKATKDEVNLKKFNFLRQISEGRFNALQAADSLAQDTILKSEGASSGLKI